MGQINARKLISCGFILSLLIGSALFIQFIHGNSNTGFVVKRSPLHSTQSTDPANPHVLYDDSSVYEWYNASTSYYYRTDNASPAQYHVAWLQSEAPPDNFDLYLYNDSGYANLQASSTRGASFLDWVVYRPNASQYLYAKINALAGSNGFAFIEWEDSSDTLTVDGSASGYLSSPDRLEVYQMYLSNASAYRFRLDVPSEGDFDLYLYRLEAGTGTNSLGYAARSWSVGSGLIEIISNYTPTESGTHALLVTRSAGSGNFVLSASNFPTTPQVLVDDSSLNETCNASASYYYQTDNASPSQYHVAWLQPHDALDDFDLHLYSDGAFSDREAASLRGNGMLEWVVFRPNTSRYFYLEVYAQAGSGGNASIEWEAGTETLSMEDSVSTPLNLTDCIEVYGVYLSNALEYQFSLDVPVGGDFDLYLYYLNPGTETNHAGYSSSSTTSGNGSDELISDYQPLIPGDYAVCVVRKSGTGTYTLNVSSIQDLQDDVAEYVQYNATRTYYYRTDVASYLYYQVVWVQPMELLDDFDLAVYSDENYSNYVGASRRGSGALDWVVFQPTTSQSYYPEVEPLGGSSGPAYIEWEEGSDLLSYLGESGSLDPSDCIEVYKVTLIPPSTYSFTLEVPPTGDFDLYLYHLNVGGAANASGYVQNSATVGNGTDETISQFEPALYGAYLVLVVRSGGSGTYNLTFEIDFPSPHWPVNFYIFLLIGAGIAGLIVVLAVLIRKRKRREVLQERRLY